MNTTYLVRAPATIPSNIGVVTSRGGIQRVPNDASSLSSDAPAIPTATGGIAWTGHAHSLSNDRRARDAAWQPPAGSALRPSSQELGTPGSVERKCELFHTTNFLRTRSERTLSRHFLHSVFVEMADGFHSNTSSYIVRFIVHRSYACASARFVTRRMKFPLTSWLHACRVD